MTSQSGGSAEVEALLDGLDPRPAAVLAITNDPASPLGRGADAILELHCGVEQTVGTRSYINTLAATARATSHALGDPVTHDLFAGPDALQDYLDNWDLHRSTIDRLVPDSTIFALGRGSSLAAAMTGALIIKEASGHPVEGMSVPQFRHGPLEMVGADTTVVLLAGGAADQSGNRAMVEGSPQVRGQGRLGGHRARRRRRRHAGARVGRPPTDSGDRAPPAAQCRDGRTSRARAWGLPEDWEDHADALRLSKISSAFQAGHAGSIPVTRSSP